MAPPPQQLTDYLTRVSESISNQKQNRLAKSLSQTSDPTYNVLLSLQDVETKSSLEMMIGRRGAALGLDTEWRGILVDRIWAGLMELKEQWIEAFVFGRLSSPLSCTYLLTSLSFSHFLSLSSTSSPPLPPTQLHVPKIMYKQLHPTPRHPNLDLLGAPTSLRLTTRSPTSFPFGRYGVDR
jgi:hypothetical protein